MELMACSLRSVLEKKPLNPAQILSIGLDVARALNYLHLMRPDPVIHRDISSANVLLNPSLNNQWIAKLSDYGSANFVRNTLTAGPGNPIYAALGSRRQPLHKRRKGRRRETNAAPEANSPSKQGPTTRAQ
jgi:serine/threonine protein kinase